MARALMVVPTTHFSATDEIRGFSRRRLSELAGIGLFGLALFLTVAMLTYDARDPSFNVASDQHPTNLFGTAGAWIADFLLQSIGLASVLLVAVALAWGWRLFSARRVRFVSLRLVALVLALSGASLLLAQIEAPLSWSFASGLGGGVGGRLLGALSLAMPGFAVTLMGLAGMLGGGVLAMALRVDEWRRIGGGAAHVGRGGLAAGAWLRGLRRERLDFEDYPEHEQAESFLARLKARFQRDEAAEEVAPRRRAPRMRHVEEEEEEYEVEDMGADDADAEAEEEAPAPRARKPRRPAQASLPLREGPYEMPELSLLNPPPKKAKRSKQDENALAQNAKMLENVLQEFGVQGKITDFRPGPVVTLYQLEPAPGTRSQRVINLSGDIARSMSAVSARISVVQGSSALGVELPNSNRETVYLRELMECEGFAGSEAKLPLALGKNISGEPVIVDLARMPHLLVAGTTGSGKSVAINTMIASLLFKHTPETCKFIMIDPKMLELSVYEGIPHLLSPVVTEPGKAIVALKWTVKEMENRYRLMSTLGVRNVEGYNKRVTEASRKGEELTRTVQTGFDADTGKPIYEEQPLDTSPLPFIVVVVDEMADLMATAGKEIEVLVQRLAQMARAAGIHIILATQRPSVDVITGVIKANFPTRISFQVTSRHDSRTILNEDGAEQLLGQGDMLYMAGGSRTTRVHGPFVSDQEVEALVAHLKLQGEPDYVEDVTRDEDADGESFEEENDEEAGLYRQAVAIVKRDKKASTSYIQRQLRIGYNRAARLIEQMENEGLVGPASGTEKGKFMSEETPGAATYGRWAWKRVPLLVENTDGSRALLVYRRRGKTALHMADCVLFAGTAFALMLSKAGEGAYGEAAFGLLGLVAFGFGALLLWVRWSDERPALTLDPHGITDNTAATGPVRLDWEHIVDFGLRDAFLAAAVADPEAALASLPPEQRAMAAQNLDYYGSLIHPDLGELQCDPQALAERIAQWHASHSHVREHASHATAHEIHG